MEIVTLAYVVLGAIGLHLVIMCLGIWYIQSIVLDVRDQLRWQHRKTVEEIVKHIDDRISSLWAGIVEQNYKDAEQPAVNHHEVTRYLNEIKSKLGIS